LRAGWSNDKWRVFAEIKDLCDEAYVATHGVRDRAAPDPAILNPGEPWSAHFGARAQF
jgi:iron complex outermembrane receptor protein